MKRTVFLFCALSLAALSQAQPLRVASAGSLAVTPPAPTTLTLEQCLALALQNQPAVRQADLQQQSAALTVEQTRRSQLPVVSGLTSQGLNQGRNVDPYTNGITNAQIGTSSAGLSLNWTIFNGFQLQNTLAQQLLTAQAHRYDAQAVRNTVLLRTLLAYLQVSSAQELLAASDVQVSTSRSQVERTEKLVRSGTMAPFNLHDARSQLASDEVQRVQAQTGLNAARLALLQELNLPSTTPLEVVRPDVDRPQAVPQSGDTDAYGVYTQARTLMPEVLAADLRTQAAQKSLDLARGLGYPTVALSAGWGTSYSSAARRNVLGADLVEQSTTGFVDVAGQRYPVHVLSPAGRTERIGYFSQLENNQYKSIGLSIRIPILNGFQVRYRTAQARLQQQLAESQAEGVRRELRQAIDQAVNQWQDAWQRYTAFEQQVTALEQSYRAAELRYAAGQLTALDYNLAKSNLDRARINQIQARYETLLRAKVVGFYRNGNL